MREIMGPVGIAAVVDECFYRGSEFRGMRSEFMDQIGRARIKHANVAVRRRRDHSIRFFALEQGAQNDSIMVLESSSHTAVFYIRKSRKRLTEDLEVTWQFRLLMLIE